MTDHIITAIITALAYWALLQVCQRGPAGGTRERIALAMGGILRRSGGNGEERAMAERRSGGSGEEQ